MSVIQSEGQVLSLFAPRAVSAAGSGWPPLGWQYMPRLDQPTGDALLQDYAALFRTQPNVRTVVTFLARNIAQLGLHAFRRVSDTERERLPQTHELSQLLGRPHPDTTRFRYIETLVTDLKIFDNHYAVKVRDPQTGRLTLLRVPPQFMRLNGTWLTTESYTIRTGKDETTVPASSVFHIHGYNPDDARMGVSPLESLRRILAEDVSAGEYRDNFWRNAARIEGTLEAQKKMTPDAVARLRAQWQEMYSGAGGSGKTAILEEGMTFKPISFSAKESEYVAARKLTREEVASAYHIAPTLVGVLENATYSNVTEQHKNLYQDTLGPDLAMIEEEFERQVLPDIADTQDTYLEFNIEEKLRGSFEEQTAALQSSVGAPYLTRNEARSKLNLPRIDGGDALVTPLNVTVGGQASPQDSVPKALRDLADSFERELAVTNGHHEKNGAHK